MSESSGLRTSELGSRRFLDLSEPPSPPGKEQSNAYLAGGPEGQTQLVNRHKSAGHTVGAQLMLFLPHNFF